MKNENDIVREIAARNIWRIYNDSMLSLCEDWIKVEKNEYVKETISSAIRKVNTNKINVVASYLPLTYKNDNDTDSLIYNKNIKGSFEYSYVKIDTVANNQMPKFEGINYPHQQYKFPIKGSPKSGKFGNNYSGIYHVGTDSGWLLEGLPVHSIGSGRVRKIQHESSWGTFVVIEGISSNDSVYTVFYGHLDSNLDVDVGDIVNKGQTIGVIGKSFTLDNGGYISHLHLGIEKSNFTNAHLKGYDNDINRYEIIDQLIKE